MLLFIVAVVYAQVTPTSIQPSVCNGMFCSASGPACAGGATCFNGRCLQTADIPMSSLGGACASSSNCGGGATCNADSRCSLGAAGAVKGVGCLCTTGADCVSGLCNTTSISPPLNGADNIQQYQTYCLASGLKNGASCAHPSQCVSQTCTSGTCQPLPNGAACGPNSIITNVAFFAPRVQQVQNPCQSGSYCTPFNYPTNPFTCQPFVAAGGACTVGVIYCAWPATCNTGSDTLSTGTCTMPGASSGSCGTGNTNNPPNPATNFISPSYFCPSGTPYCGTAASTHANQCFAAGAGLAIGSNCAGLFYVATGAVSAITQGMDKMCASGACDKLNAYHQASASCITSNSLPFGSACAGNWDTTVCPSGSFCSRVNGAPTTYICARGSLHGSGSGGYCVNDDGCSGPDMKCVDNLCSVAATGRICGVPNNAGSGSGECLSQYGNTFLQTTGDQNGLSLTPVSTFPVFGAYPAGSWLQCECTKGGNVFGQQQCVTATAAPCFSQKQAFITAVGTDYFSVSFYPYANYFQPYNGPASNPSTLFPYVDPTTQSYIGQVMIAIAYTGTSSQKSALIAYLCCATCASGSPGLDGSVNANQYVAGLSGQMSYIIRALPGPLNCGSQSFGTWATDDSVARCQNFPAYTPEIPYTDAVVCSSAFDVAPKVVIILAAALLAVVLMLAH